VAAAGAAMKLAQSMTLRPSKGRDASFMVSPCRGESFAPSGVCGVPMMTGRWASDSRVRSLALQSSDDQGVNMPVRIIGMIGVDPPKGNTLHVISGGISPGFLAEFSQAHEDAGFDLVLVGDYSSSSDGFGVASYMNDFRRCVAAQGRPAPGFNMSFRPIIAPTEGQA
jgi:hypothetical protein